VSGRGERIALDKTDVIFGHIWQLHTAPDRTGGAAELRRKTAGPTPWSIGAKTNWPSIASGVRQFSIKTFA